MVAKYKKRHNLLIFLNGHRKYIKVKLIFLIL